MRISRDAPVTDSLLESSPRAIAGKFHERCPDFVHVDACRSPVSTRTPLQEGDPARKWRPTHLFYANPTLLLDADNTPQPDSVLCTAPRPGGHVWLNEKGYLCGRPELICEVAASCASIDLHDKLQAYRRNGNAEYLVWVVAERRIRWFALVEQEYVEMKERGGVIVSRVFPKLALDVKAMLKFDGAKVPATLRRRLDK